MFLKSSRATKFLLASGLLLVLAQGFVSLPAFQDLFFPGNLLETRQFLTTKECGSIEKDLTKFRNNLNDLMAMEETKISNTSLERPLPAHLSQPFRAWANKLYFVKKKRVGLERRLKNIDASLKSLTVILDKSLGPEGQKITNRPEINDKLLDLKMMMNCLAYYQNEFKAISHELDNIEDLSKRN